MEESVAVAVLGTGLMGSGMASSLLRAGHPVWVWNRSPDRAAPLADEGAVVADSVGAAVAGAMVVITMLPDANVTSTVISAALPAFRQDAVWAQMGTVGLAGVRGLEALAQGAGIAFVDAPVSGSREPAEAGQLLVLASGPPTARPLVQPVFDAVGRRTAWVGEAAGPATALKLAVNGWMLSALAALAEALLLAQTLEVDPMDFLDAIAEGPLDLPMAQPKGRAMVAREFPASFPLRLAEKDAELVLQAVLEHNLDLPLAQATGALLAKARALGLGDQDVAALSVALTKDPTAAG